MLQRKSIVNRNLLATSPRMARSKGQTSTASTRYAGSQRPDLKDNNFLEVVSLANQDGQQPRVRMENTYKLDPDTPFRSKKVESAAESILAEVLEDKKYDPVQCKMLSQTLSAKILEEIKELGFSRYKMVAVVSIGSMKERPGMQFGSRCLWNKDTDNFISAKYNNTSLFAVAMVYGLYYD